MNRLEKYNQLTNEKNQIEKYFNPVYLNIQKNNNEITKELFSMDERYNNNDNILNKRYKMNKIKIHNNNGYQVKEKKDNKNSFSFYRFYIFK